MTEKESFPTWSQKLWTNVGKNDRSRIFNRHSTESDDDLLCSELNPRSECCIYLTEIVVSAALDSMNATLKCILGCLT